MPHVSRSRIELGVGCGLFQTMALRGIQPSSCRASATCHCVPSKFLCGMSARGR
jgi:hypothetical protein